MIKVRFAPSPTGYLHIGGARTALINWLYARKEGGKFVLRVEDTDEQRSTPEMTDAILDGLSWLGMDWDEGPHYQSERKELHRRTAFELLERGNAYRCFCSKEELETRKNALEKPEEWKYDRKCRDLPAEEAEKRAASGEPFVVRCRVPDENIEWDDVVKGKISFAAGQLEDFVLLRSDLSPVYNLSVVADDNSMGITHIIRGEDHISNTPKQIAIYKALGLVPPLFGHLPLILGPDRKKLSKRHGTTSVTAYRDEGVLPLALFNFLASLGTSLDEEKCLSREELVERFELQKIKRSASVFDRERLNFLNGKLISGTPAEDVEKLVMPLFAERFPGLRYPGAAAVALMKTRAKNIPELADSLYIFSSEDFGYEEKALAKIDRAAVTSHFGGFMAALRGVEEWRAASIELALRGFADSAGVKAKDLIHPSRLFLCGKGESPSIFDLLEAVGKEKSLARLEKGLKFIEAEVKNAQGSPS